MALVAETLSTTPMKQQPDVTMLDVTPPPTQLYTPNAPRKSNAQETRICGKKVLRRLELFPDA